MSSSAETRIAYWNAHVRTDGHSLDDGIDRMIGSLKGVVDSLSAQKDQVQDVIDAVETQKQMRIERPVVGRDS